MGYAVFLARTLPALHDYVSATRISRPGNARSCLHVALRFLLLASLSRYQPDSAATQAKSLPSLSRFQPDSGATEAKDLPDNPLLGSLFQLRHCRGCQDKSLREEPFIDLSLTLPQARNVSYCSLRLRPTRQDNSCMDSMCLVNKRGSNIFCIDVRRCSPQKFA